jgi:hypothetical protein
MSESTVSEQSVSEMEALLKTEDDGNEPEAPSLAYTLAELKRPFHPSVRRQKAGFTYIPHGLVRRRIIKATRNSFSWEVNDMLFRDGAEISQQGKTVCIVIGTLTIPNLGKRTGIGAAMIQKGTEDQAKSAESDAFKRAAMAFGVALELYGDDLEAQIADRSAYTSAAPAWPTPAPNTTASTTTEVAARPASQPVATNKQPPATPQAGIDPSWGNLSGDPESWTGKGAFWKKRIDDYFAGEVGALSPEKLAAEFQRAKPPQPVVDYFKQRSPDPVLTNRILEGEAA